MGSSVFRGRERLTASGEVLATAQVQMELAPFRKTVSPRPGVLQPAQVQMELAPFGKTVDPRPGDVMSIEFLDTESNDLLDTESMEFLDAF